VVEQLERLVAEVDRVTAVDEDVVGDGREHDVRDRGGIQTCDGPTPPSFPRSIANGVPAEAAPTGSIWDARLVHSASGVRPRRCKTADLIACLAASRTRAPDMPPS
jgi:hypothetical protein